MNKQPSVKKNVILNMLYQILLLLTPFITAPYVSRILGADGIGIYSYTYSIEMYFSMFAALGTVCYGEREIARNRNDKYQRSKLFWEIELLTIMTTSICCIIWTIWIFFNQEYKVYFIILTFYLLATMFDISWFYTGIEQFKYIILPNICFKLLGIISIFIFVNNKNDIVTYILIMSLTVLLSNISMWIFLPKYIENIPWRQLKILRHCKETLVYFIPTIATSIYTVLDKTLIGLITKSNSENGYYEQATKIINMAKTVTFTAINSVLGSRISFLFSQEKYNEIKLRIEQSMNYILFMGFGVCFGLISISNRFVPCFFGLGYEKVIVLLNIFSPIVIIIGISNCLGSLYYTPAGLRIKSAKYLIIGSIINLVINLLLIPKFWSYGAILSSIIAESVITFLYLSNCKSYMSIKYILKNSWKKIIAGLIMLIVIKNIDKFILNDTIATIIECMMGISIYCFVLIILKDTIIRNIITMIKEKFKR